MALRFDTERISNGGSEAINGVIEKTRRLAHGSAPSITTRHASCSQPMEPGPTGEPQRSEEPH
jgi:hypothetical protein